MPFVRETIDLAVKALFDPLISGTLKSVSRRWKAFAEVPAKSQPAMFIVKTPERTEREEGTPPRHWLTYELYIYTNFGHGRKVIPATGLNSVLDAVDGALGGSPIDGIETLGGLVSHVYKNGATEIHEGTLGDQTVSIVPLEALLNADNQPGQPFFWFNSGTLYAIPTRDADGNTIPSTSTPVRMGTLKGITIDVSTETVEPSHQLQYKFDMAWNLKTIKGTARIASINSRMWNQVFFGQDLETGGEHIQTDEGATIPGSPFQITPAPPDAGTILKDLGVFFDKNGDADDGKQLARVTGAPALLEYSFSAGTYTFNAGKTTKKVLISYSYSTASGNQLNVMNRFTQKAPRFAIYLTGGYNGRKISWTLPVCVTQSFALPTAVENFAIQDFGFEALEDGQGLVTNISLI